MKSSNSPYVALSVALLLGSSTLSQAVIIISDDFSYGDGSLDQKNGGTGFSGAWATSALNVANGVATGNADARRDFIGNEFGNTGTIWLSFDFGFSAAPGENASYGGLTFYTNGFENFLIGNTWPGSNHDKWGMNGVTVSSESLVGMKTAVARIQLGTGATSIVDLWVGMTGSPVDVSGPALLTSTGRDLDGVNGIRVNGVDFGNGTNQSFDNLIIATTMAEINAVPEPGAALLGGFGLLALLRRRRA